MMNNPHETDLQAWFRDQEEFQEYTSTQATEVTEEVWEVHTTNLTAALFPRYH